MLINAILKEEHAMFVERSLGYSLRKQQESSSFHSDATTGRRKKNYKPLSKDPTMQVHYSYYRINAAMLN